MKVLSIGKDKNLDIFKTGSAVAERNIAYGKSLGEVHIIVFGLKSSRLSSQKISDEVSVYSTQSSSRWFYVFDAIRLGKNIILDNKFVRGEAVVTCQDPFECGFVGWRITQHFRLPLHLQVHTDFLSPYFTSTFFQKFRVWWGKFLLPRAAGVRVVSERISDSITTHGIRLKRPAVVLPIRVDTVVRTVTPEHDLHKLYPQFKFIILIASRLTTEKRIPDALQAFAEVLQSYAFAGLVIAGSGPEKSSLENHARMLGIGKSVIFLGWQDDITQLMQSADAFLSTSEFEGYGMSMMQAGLAGTPVVSTDVGIAGSILRDNETALVCPVGDVQCIAGKIIQFIHDSALGTRLSQNLKDEVVKGIPSEEQYVIDYAKDLQSIVLHVS